MRREVNEVLRWSTYHPIAIYVPSSILGLLIDYTHFCDMFACLVSKSSFDKKAHTQCILPKSIDARCCKNIIHPTCLRGALSTIMPLLVVDIQDVRCPLEQNKPCFQTGFA